MNTFDYVCGGAAAGTSTAGEPIRLDVQGKGRNVNLRITDINRAMLSCVPEVLLDLLEIAAYVYCADQQSSRGSENLTGHGREWRRMMNFTIPVRQPEIWASTPVVDALCETIGFLSDDTYAFFFVKATEPLADREAYFPDLVDGSFSPDEVALFSGGVDSFAGAVETLSGERKRLALVGHYSCPKVFNVQKQLIEGLRRGGLANQIFYVPVNVTNAGVAAREYTQRTRSFLFACLALVVSRMFGKDEFTFYENGVVSLNLPLAKDVLGARATRTTHPKVIRGFEDLFSAILERDITIRTPFQWLTKKEVTGKVAEHGFGQLLATTSSCTRPRSWSRNRHHCGACSQCIDRRFAILAAGLDQFDPAEGYELDLLIGDRSLDRDLRMAIAYVKFFQNFASSSKSRFISDHPQVTSALRYFPDLSTDAAAERVHDLYHRYAEDVLAVIEDGIRKYSVQLVRGELPGGSLLSMCFSRGSIQAPVPPSYDQEVKLFVDRLEKPACEFAVDEDARRIFFSGDFSLDGANFNLIRALLPNHRSGKTRVPAHVAFITPAELADELRIDEASLRQQVGRTRKLVSERLGVDQGIVLGIDDFIENRQREGYRLNPALREVARADLQVLAEPMSQA
jgi:hypothetical protein